MVRRIVFILAFVVLFAGTLAGIGFAGLAVTMGQSFPDPLPVKDMPDPKPVVPGRVVVVAAAGLLDGGEATSFWANLDRLDSAYSKVKWLRGKRYVEHGRIVTTAGVTSGVAGALRVVESTAGAGEARRLAQDVSYPGSTLDIAENRYAAADLPYALGALFPYFRPTLGIGLADGVDEIDVAAAFDVYSGTSSATHAIPIAANATVTTRHGAVLLAHRADSSAPQVDRLVVAGSADPDAALAGWAQTRGLKPETPQASDEFAYDPLLRDLATQADRATARATAKFTEYPGRPELSGPVWPWRPTLLALLAMVVSVGVGLLPILVARRFK